MTKLSAVSHDNGFYSPLFLELTNLLSTNEQMRTHRIEAQSDKVVEFMRSYEYGYGTWPMLLSVQRVKQFDHFVKVLPELCFKVLREYFNDAQSFADYFGVSPMLFDMLQQVEIEPSSLMIRHDLVFSVDKFKLLEINAGSSIGGWQLDFLSPQFKQVLQSNPHTSSWDLRQRNVIENMIKSLLDSIQQTKPTDARGNILLFSMQDDFEFSNIKKEFNQRFDVIKLDKFSDGQLFWCEDFAHIKFLSNGDVAYRGQIVDAVVFTFPEGILPPQNMQLQFVQSFIAGRIVFPDSPLHTIIGNKQLLGLLHEAKDKLNFTAEQLQLIDDHIPWASNITRTTIYWRGQQISMLSLLQNHKDELVIKKSESLQGRDVFVGKFTSQSDWQVIIEQHIADSGWLVQEYCESVPVEMCDLKGQMRFNHLIWGVFDINNSYSGAFIRANAIDEGNGVINSASGAIEYAVFEQQPDNDIPQIIQMCEQEQVELSVEDGALEVFFDEYPSDELLSLLKLHKLELVDYFIEYQQKQEALATIPISKMPVDEHATPISYAQQLVWLMEQMDHNDSRFNMSYRMEVRGAFNLAAAESAFAAIIRCHEPLRTVYVNDTEGSVQQIINSRFKFKLQQIDLTEFTVEQRQAELEALLLLDAKKPFKLSCDLLLRVSFVHLAPAQGILLLNMHHIGSDGWSMGVLIREFIQHYRSIAHQIPLALKPMEIQYKDYAYWQRHSMTAKFEQQLQYWHKTLNGLAPVHNMPLDYVRPQTRSFEGGQHQFTIDSDVYQQLERLASNHQASLFMVLHGAFSILVSRYSNSSDVAMGTLVANRTQPILEPLIGFFANTLVLRITCDPQDSFSEYLQQIKSVNLDAQANQDVPFELVVERLNPQRSNSNAPLFQIMISMDNSPKDEIEMDGLSFVPLPSDKSTSLFDLTLHITVDKQGLKLTFEYSRDLFLSDTIVRMANQLSILLGEIAYKSEIAIKDLTLLDEKAQSYLSDALNDTAQPYSDEQLIHEMIESQVERTPEACAVVFLNQSLTYRQLNEHSNRLAAYLIESGVGPDKLVGLYLKRSVEMVIAIVAVLKAGGGYLPLDPNYPQQRLEYMIADSGINLLVTQVDIQDSVPQGIAQVIVLDNANFIETLNDYSIQNPARTNGLMLNHIAYVIYTSGSTGNPKGVMIEHRALINRIQWMQQEYQLTDDDVVLQKTPFSFDVSVWEFIWPLSYGATMVVAKPEGHKDPAYLVELIQEQQVTTLHFVPSMLRIMLDSEEFQWSKCNSLTRVFCSGEALPTDVVNRHYKANQAQLNNLYGPTEAAIDVTYWSCPNDSTLKLIPIGKAIANIQLYILDKYSQLSPFGVVGELYIAGVGLARGYLNRPELTEARFVTIKIPGKQPQRMYKTGDLARYLPSGDIEFFGRIDHQVKLRGFRIELGEIEHHILQSDIISAALVTAIEDQRGEQRLVAYYCIDETLNQDSQFDEASFLAQLKNKLYEALPEYMVPSVFILMENMPLSANGKIDLKALPAWDSALNQNEYVAAGTETEHVLVDIWAQLLNIDSDKISTSANFFDLGGHSLLAMRMVAEIRSKIGIELLVRDIFQSVQLSQLGMLIDGETIQGVRPNIVPFTRKSNILPASFAQQRLWFVDQMQGGSAQYNIPIALKVQGLFNVEAAEQAISRIISRHESLRTVFSMGVDGVEQVIRASFDFTLEQINYSELADDIKDETVKNNVTEDALKTFDLQKDLMIRGSYLKLSTEQKSDSDVLLLNMHHIAADGWSMGLLLKEFVSQYQAVLEGKDDPLVPLPIQYSDYAQWQKQWLTGEVLQGQLDFWLNQLDELPAVHTLPLDYPRSANKTYQGAVVSSKLDAQTSLALQQMAKDHQLTPFMLLHGLLALVLSRHSYNHDIVMGTPSANRGQAELSALIGFFVNVLVLRVNTNFDTLAEYFSHVRSVNLDAHANQDVSFEQLVEQCNVPRSSQHSPLFQIMFSMNTNETFDLACEQVSFKTIDNGTFIAKFDLDINAYMNDNGVYFSWVYDTNLFSRKSVERLSDDVNYLLKGIAARPMLLLKDLPLLDLKQKNQLLVELNDASPAKNRGTTIHGLFEQQVKKSHHDIALVYRKGDNDNLAHENTSMTYIELNQAANRLAHLLMEQSVTIETPVGICLNRNEQMVVAIIAVLKAGGTYVPLDPLYPASRLEFIMTDSKIRHIITDQCVANLKVNAALCENADLQVTCIDLPVTQRSLLDYSNDNPLNEDEQADSRRSHIIYTSGSTGQPKGVMVEHRNVTAMLSWATEYYSNDELACVLAATSVNFDLSLFEIFAPLVSGGCSLVVESIMSLVTDDLSDAQITLLNSVPSAIDEVVRQNAIPSSVKTVNLAGEVLTRSLASKIYECGNVERIYNLYGPTEDTTYSLASLVSRKPQEPSIGRPIHGTKVYVVDIAGGLAPFGRVGELYLGGRGVTRGYLNRPGLTKEKFIENPFDVMDGQRLYKTGDIVRYDQNGDILYLGRSDSQVKIRGFRIELGEIESRLSLCEGVERCVVIVKGHGDQQRLVAYLLLSHTVDESEELTITRCKAFLTAALPLYMIPSQFLILDQFKLTANGKIDRNALPETGLTPQTSKIVLAIGRSETELLQIWSELLKVDKSAISVTDNFFDLGGHSLLVVRMVAALREQLHFELPLKAVYDSPTIKQIAALLDDRKPLSSRTPIIRIQRHSEEPILCSYAQQRMYLIDQQTQNTGHYNLPCALQIDGVFNENYAEQAFSRIISRHEALRTRFIYQIPDVLQVVTEAFEFSLIRENLSELPTHQQTEVLQGLINKDAVKPFDLENDLMMRASYIRLSPQHGVLLFNVHHIAADGWSLNLIVNEFTTQYRAISEGNADLMTELKIHYADYAYDQRQRLKGDELTIQLDYWQQALTNIPPVHSLPLDHPRPKRQTANGGCSKEHLDLANLQSLQQIAANNEATLFMVLQSAFALLLSRYCDCDDIVMGTPVANRMDKALEPLVGLFVNTLVLRLDCSPEVSFNQFLTLAREVHLDAQTHQEVPFDLVVERLSPERSASYSPVFQILFAMDTNEVVNSELSGLNITPLKSDKVSAKVDLSLFVVIGSQGLTFDFIYNNDIFDKSTIEQLASHYIKLLQSIAEDASENIHNYQLNEAPELEDFDDDF